MSQKPLAEHLLQEAFNANNQYGSPTEAAKALNINRTTYLHRVAEARRRGLRPGRSPSKKELKHIDELHELRHRARALEDIVKQRQVDNLTGERIRQTIFKLSSAPPKPPEWLLRSPVKSKRSPGVPTLQLSDFHWGEVVDPNQIGGVNSFNLTIARRRLRSCVEITVDLLKHHMVNPNYPGLVVILGGDMVTGDIHEELSVTNEREIMPTFVDLFGNMIWAIETLADAFGNIFLPCVTGNHGRNTFKIRNKGRAFTSFDWLLYVMLEKHFLNDKRVRFLIPDGPDALYRIYNQRYLLTHGDQFRGGDSIIGALGPLTRGNQKKIARNSQINQAYDTMVVGHWHQRIMLNKLIVNSSLKGYDEYAAGNNFSFEPPSQNIWLTHPDHGITLAMPVYVDKQKAGFSAEWVSVLGDKKC